MQGGREAGRQRLGDDDGRAMQGGRATAGRDCWAERTTTAGRCRDGRTTAGRDCWAERTTTAGRKQHGGWMQGGRATTRSRAMTSRRQGDE